MKQLDSVDQLITIHGKLQTGRGRRYEQDALHRAGVVLTVAAWQAYVENLVYEGLDVISTDLRDSKAPIWTLQAFKMRGDQVKGLVKRLNTPNDVNVRNLFQDSFDFEPWPAWGWSAGSRSWNFKEMRKRTNDWLRVRHSIAHGVDLPDDIRWLKGNNRQARLTLELLRECRAHFRHIADKTDAAFSKHLVDEFGIPQPW